MKTIRNHSHLFVLLLNILLTTSCIKSKETKSFHEIDKIEKQKQTKITRKSHLSGWYPNNPTHLNTEIDDFLVLAQNNFYTEVDPNSIRAIIVPHAGFYYSGLCAATVYQSLLATKNLNSRDLKNKTISRVIILSPSHTTYFDGIALPDYSTYKTPLGAIETDHETLKKLSLNSTFKIFGKAHEREHAIEIQLPFLQKTIELFSIVPLVVGNIKNMQELESITKSLKQIIDEKTLIVVSSDFMHYGKNYEYTPFKKNILNQIKYVDSVAIQAITSKSLSSFERVISETETTICGKNSIKILLSLLENEYVEGIEPRLTCYYTSAHIAQARKLTKFINPALLIGNIPDVEIQNSVSYAGIVFTQQKISKLKKENQLTGYEKKALLKLSREAVENEFKDKEEKIENHLLWPIVSPGIEKIAGAFVTLNTSNGALRGCIGKITSFDSIYKTIAYMAKQAAFHDGRFKPVIEKELSDIIFDISILTPPKKVSSLQEIILGKHGIILNKFSSDGRLKASSVFLPQVPKNLDWDLQTTLEHLSTKAGLEKNAWKEGIELQIFEGFEIKEEL
jgi:MEMO1 family protein